LTRYKQIERRLAKLEQILDKRTQRAEPALYIQVDLEAQQQFPPEDLPLLQSAKAARHEGRFHSLEEHEVMERFSRLRDVVGRRYGFASYGWVIRRDINRLSSPQSKSIVKESADALAMMKVLNWGPAGLPLTPFGHFPFCDLDCDSSYLREQRQDQQAALSNSSHSGTESKARNL
jgi:hypothetical protein